MHTRQCGHLTQLVIDYILVNWSTIIKTKNEVTQMRKRKWDKTVTLFIICTNGIKITAKLRNKKGERLKENERKTAGEKIYTKLQICTCKMMRLWDPAWALLVRVGIAVVWLLVIIKCVKPPINDILKYLSVKRCLNINNWRFIFLPTENNLSNI